MCIRDRFVPKPIERTVLERVLRKVLPKSCIRYTPRPAVADMEASGSVPAEPDAPEAADGAESPYDRLARAGVNTELGLDYCAGDESFYREMLRMFCAQRAEKRAELDSLYESADWADYAVKVHALKSTSLTIGAQTLSDRAKELELAGKRGDGDYIRERHGALLEAYDALCAQIGESVLADDAM